MIKLDTETVHGTWRLSHGLANQYRQVIETYDMSDDPYPDVPLVDVDSQMDMSSTRRKLRTIRKNNKRCFSEKERDQSWARYVQEKLRLGEETDTQEWYGVWDNESENTH